MIDVIVTGTKAMNEQTLHSFRETKVEYPKCAGCGCRIVYLEQLSNTPEHCSSCFRLNRLECILDDFIYNLESLLTKERPNP